MADPTTTPPVVPPAPAISPTGQAILAPRFVPYALAIVTLPAAFAGVFKAYGLYPQAQLFLMVASGLLWAILGVISPGLRRAPMAALAVTLCLLSEAPAFAQTTPTRAWGGCFNPSICAGPTLAVSLTQVSLADWSPQGTFTTDLGYGLTFFSNRWYTIGLSAAYSVSAMPGQPATFAPSGVLSFAEYLRVGYKWSKTAGQKPEQMLLLGLGFEIGGSTPQTAALVSALRRGP